MSDEVLRKSVQKIAEHVADHNLKKVSIVLHGGEPLLAGYDFIHQVFSLFSEKLGSIVEFGMQSNLTLLTPEIVNLFSDFHASIGVSLDGPRNANDQHRITHSGDSSFDDVMRGFDILRSTQKGRDVFSGILAVIDTENDPIEVYEFLRSLKPRGMDFLLPDATHEAWPPSKASWEETPYADWMIRLFDYWWRQSDPTPIRFFENIITLRLGSVSDNEALGLGSVNLLVIETDGSIEAVDTLKVDYDGAPDLGLHILNNTIDDAMNHPKITMRNNTEAELSRTCSQCAIVKICGGGYLPHRYSKEALYRNPSVYCTDLKKLITHVIAITDLTLKQSLAVHA